MYETQLKCPYNGFKNCYRGGCVAWGEFQHPIKSGCYIRTCAIAFNGGVPINVQLTGKVETTEVNNRE